jgi:hypothetical protein
MAKLEKVTAADVAAAEKALAEGRTRLDQLHDAYIRGVGEWQPVVDQRAVIEYAEAQVLRTAYAKSEYDEKVRRAALENLRKEIDDYSLVSGDEFTKLLTAVEESVVAFANAFKVRNDRLQGWRDTAASLEVGTMQGRVVPSADDAGIALMGAFGGGVLQVGNRILTVQHSGRILTSLLHSLATTHDLIPYYQDANSPINDINAVRNLVAELDHEAAAIPEDALFFRNREGSVRVTGPVNPYPEEIMKRDGLVQISREEAMNA